MSARKKKKFLTYEEQYEIVKKLKTGVSHDSIIQEYGISKSLCYELPERSLKILEKLNNSLYKDRKTSKSSENKLLDTAMITWYYQAKNRGEPINGPILQEKALVFKEKLNLSSEFRASTGWLYRFKKRYGLRVIDNSSENDSDRVKQFSHFLKEKIDFDNLFLGNIYNADESGIQWRTLVSCIFDGDEKKEIPESSANEDRVTALFCANATGSHQIPLLIIGKSEPSECLNSCTVSELNNSRLFESLGIIYTHQSKSWMDRHIFLLWYKEIFIPRVLEHQVMFGLAGKVILILDNAPSHLPLSELNAIDKNFEVVCMLPNVSASIQPMEQGLISTTKKLFKKNLLRCLLVNDKTQGADKFLRNLSLPDCLALLSNAWDSLKTSTLQKVWKLLLDNSYFVSIQDPLFISRPADNASESSKYVVEESSFPHEIGDQLFWLLSGPNRSAERTKQLVLKWFESEDDDCGWGLMSDDEIVQYVTIGKEEIEKKEREFVAVKDDFEKIDGRLNNSIGTVKKQNKTSDPSQKQSNIKTSKSQEVATLKTFKDVGTLKNCMGNDEEIKNELVVIKYEVDESENCLDNVESLEVFHREALEGLTTVKKWIVSNKEISQQHLKHVEELENIIRRKMSESVQKKVYLTL